jgi:hypothetical protein
MSITRFEPPRPSVWRRLLDWLEPQGDPEPPLLAPPPRHGLIETTAMTIRYERPSRLEYLKEAALLESDEALLADQPGLAFAALERWRVHYAASLREAR